MNPGQCPSGLGATNIVNSCLGMAGASVSRVAAALHCGRPLVGRRAALLAGGALRQGTLPGRQLGSIFAAAHKWLPTAVTSCSSQGAGTTRPVSDGMSGPAVCAPPTSRQIPYQSLPVSAIAPARVYVAARTLSDTSISFEATWSPFCRARRGT